MFNDNWMYVLLFSGANYDEATMEQQRQIEKEVHFYVFTYMSLCKSVQQQFVF